MISSDSLRSHLRALNFSPRSNLPTSGATPKMYVLSESPPLETTSTAPLPWRGSREG